MMIRGAAGTAILTMSEARGLRPATTLQVKSSQSEPLCARLDADQA